MELLNKYKSHSILAILLGGIFLSGCYYDNEEELYPFSNLNCDTLSVITYSNTIQAIANSNCAISGCHTGVNPTGGIKLETYQQMKSIADNSKLSSRVLVEKNMPPSGPLSNCDLEAIQIWINSGAPE
jgi:hypothetical protein